MNETFVSLNCNLFNIFTSKHKRILKSQRTVNSIKKIGKLFIFIHILCNIWIYIRWISLTILFLKDSSTEYKLMHVFVCYITRSLHILIRHCAHETRGLERGVEREPGRRGQGYWAAQGAHQVTVPCAWT